VVSEKDVARRKKARNKNLIRAPGAGYRKWVSVMFTSEKNIVEERQSSNQELNEEAPRRGTPISMKGGKEN